jgi:hypothetical protein
MMRQFSVVDKTLFIFFSFLIYSIKNSQKEVFFFAKSQKRSIGTKVQDIQWAQKFLGIFDILPDHAW